VLPYLYPMTSALDQLRTALSDGTQRLGLPLSPEQHAACLAHWVLVQAHNSRAGLTSLSDPVEVAHKHYLDSLTCLLARDPAEGERVADLGSGAGFPGLVLALVRPQARFTLLDSSQKRADFLRLAATELGLVNVEVVTSRAEEAGRNHEHRDRYDVVTARALAPLRILLEYGLPLARVGGCLLAMKGPEAEAELAASQHALSVLGAGEVQTRRVTLPDGAGERVLILVEKRDTTPSRYPRVAGMPGRRPL
jgi:16S rRNA (guanine527-N7)-methyltransferase